MKRIEPNGIETGRGRNRKGFIMDSLIISAEYATNPADRPDHSGNFYQILYITEGSADYIIDKKLYHAVCGQVVFWGPSEQPSAIYAGSDYKRYAIRIRTFSPHEITRNQKLYSLLQHFTDSHMKVLNLMEHQNDIQSSFERIVREAAADQEWKEDILNLLLLELLMRLYRLEPDSSSGGHKENADIVLRIQNLLETQYHSSYTLAKLASDYGISASYLSHIFREFCGTSIMRYLLNCRMAAAKRFLSQTDLTVNEIVELCGFTDFSNFSRTFKREVGCTPTQYRQKAYK